METAPVVSKIPEIELPEYEQKWLEAQNFNHAPTENRHDAVKFLNETLEIPYRNGAVFKAFDSGDIPTALVSGRACASKYDIARWAMLRKHTPRNRNVSA